MDEQTWWLRPLESMIAAAIALGLAFIGGFVIPGFHNPVALVGIPVVTGILWWYRPELAQNPRLVWVVAAALVLLAILFLISPSQIGRALDSIWRAGPAI